MPDKELRRMSRSELIEIIFAYQQNEKTLISEKEELQKKLDDRIIKINKAGSIAEAALEINDVFKSVEDAALQYLASIKQIKEETSEKSQKILLMAEQEASRIIEEAKAQASIISGKTSAPEDNSSPGEETIED